MKIGIIVAMEKEFVQLKTLLDEPRAEKHHGRHYILGHINNNEMIMMQCGIGKVNAALCTQLLILNFKVSKIINTGIAGAVGEGLSIYDFVVSTEALYHDFDTTFFGYKPGQVPGMPEAFTADPALVDAAMTAFEQTDFHDLKIVKGRIASGDQFISGGERKAFIINTFQPQCVEMEGCAIAQACYANKVPFVIIRCMSDTADDSVKETYSEETAAKLSSNFLLEVIKQI